MQSPQGPKVDSRAVLLPGGSRISNQEVGGLLAGPHESSNLLGVLFDEFLVGNVENG